MHHIYSAEKLEIKAEKILENYKNGQYLESIIPVDVDEFTEFYLDANIDYANLSNDYKTLGLTCFYDGYIEVWNEDRTEVLPLYSKGNTIFLETETEIISSLERTRFTIMHECSHIILHKRFYYVGEEQKRKVIEYLPYRHETWEKNPPMTETDIHEWQANRLAAALLVPRKTLIAYLKKELQLDSLYKLEISSQLISKLASLYEVSNQMMKRRLRDLEIIEDYFGG